MGVFGAVSGRRGDAGFKGPLLGARSGVVGFNVATLSRLVREKVRPVWPDVCVSAKKFALHAQNTPKSAFSGVLGEFAETLLGGRAGRACGPAVVGSRASFDATWSRQLGPTGGVSPSMRSYTPLVVAGCGRPPRPQQSAPQRKALTKGKCLPVKVVTSLDNGRKWRVSAGRTLELLR